MSNLIRLDKSGRLLVEGKQTGTTARPDGMAILVIDRSGSMSGLKTEFASDGAWDFSRAALGKGYRVAIVDFASGANITCAPSREPKEVRVGCFANSVGGGTQMHEGLRLAGSLRPRAGDTIVVVTDGIVDDPPGTLAIGSKLKTVGVEILAIGTDDADKTFLAQLASRSDLAMKVVSTDLRRAITDASKLLGPSRK